MEVYFKMKKCDDHIHTPPPLNSSHLKLNLIQILTEKCSLVVVCGIQLKLNALAFKASTTNITRIYLVNEILMSDTTYIRVV